MKCSNLKSIGFRSVPAVAPGLFALGFLVFAAGAASVNIASAVGPVMISMDHVGPRPSSYSDKKPRTIDLRPYAKIVHVAPDGDYKTIGAALAAIGDASAKNRYAVLVAAGTYAEAPVKMKPFVDLFGGFGGGDWKTPEVYKQASILDGRGTGPVVIGADDARLDGFTVTGGKHRGHGAGIFCDGTSPTLVNNIIVGNQTLAPTIAEGLGKQIASEGAAIALLNGSRAYVANNIISENTTEVGNAAGISCRGNVQARILRNVFCNNTSGVKDVQVFHGKVGSRSSPGAAISCCDASSPQISFNVIVMCAAINNNDGGGIWVEGNSEPKINYNWIAGNTSGDDGGGVYVMGNLYYNDEGERLDTAPDNSVAVEDNIIAGNNTVRGGPGGLRVSRFGRVDIRRNWIIANEKGGAAAAEGAMICVNEGNVSAANGAKRTPANPKFRATAEITKRRYDERACVTELAISTESGAVIPAASVVRIGGQWSVVKSGDPAGVVVWGKISDEAGKIEVLADYTESDPVLPPERQRQRKGAE
jgi:hypothetical protein